MKFEKVVEGITIHSNEEISEQIAKAYIAYVRKNNPRKEIDSIDLEFDGEEVGLGYHLQPEGFEKIRRITGYLVGTVDRFNDAKRAEEHDRVKHAYKIRRQLMPSFHYHSHTWQALIIQGLPVLLLLIEYPAYHHKSKNGNVLPSKEKIHHHFSYSPLQR